MPAYEDVRAEARRLAAELLAAQADGGPAQPRGADGAGDRLVSDLDSLSLVELTVGLEPVVGTDILDDLDQFTGRTVDDLAAFAVNLAAQRDEPRRLKAQGPCPHLAAVDPQS